MTKELPVGPRTHRPPRNGGDPPVCGVLAANTPHGQGSATLTDAFELFGRSGGAWPDNTAKRLAGAAVWLTAVGMVVGWVVPFR
ncbi:MAG: hypothetical protein RI900_1513 [Actinomycetota bacterium]